MHIFCRNKWPNETHVLHRSRGGWGKRRWLECGYSFRESEQGSTDNTGVLTGSPITAVQHDQNPHYGGAIYLAKAKVFYWRVGGGQGRPCRWINKRRNGEKTHQTAFPKWERKDTRKRVKGRRRECKGVSKSPRLHTSWEITRNSIAPAAAGMEIEYTAPYKTTITKLLEN